MVRVTCLSPMKNYSYYSSLLFSSCSLGSIDSSSFKQWSFYSKQTSGNHTKQTTSTTKNNTPIQKKGFKKSALKDKARCYGYENARNAENEATVEKKQLSEDLYYNRIENYKLDLF